jgi:hypothetical protein
LLQLGLAAEFARAARDPSIQLCLDHELAAIDVEPFGEARTRRSLQPIRGHVGYAEALIDELRRQQLVPIFRQLILWPGEVFTPFEHVRPRACLGNVPDDPCMMNVGDSADLTSSP